MKKFLTANTIKTIAIFAMLIDHIAWAFVPTYTPLGQIMHIIGRITGPTMCYFIAEGYYHTHNVKRYAIRLALFAVISYIPFIFFETTAFPTAASFLSFNVIYTLFLGLLALWAWDKIQNKILKSICIFLLCLLSILGDWPIFGVLFILAFGINYNNFKKQFFWFTIVVISMMTFLLLPYVIVNFLDFFKLSPYNFTNIPSIKEAFLLQAMHLGVFLSPLLLSFYNGERGNNNKWNKWTFYLFYPIHLLILGYLKILFLS